MAFPGLILSPRLQAMTGPLMRQLPVVCLLFLVILGYFGALEGAASHGPLGHVQDTATAYLDRSQTKAVEAFAAGRGLNAAVSVLKSVEISPLLARFAPLEVLEPIDDLAKEFSDVMALSIAAILVQRLLLAVAQSWAFGVALPLGCLLWVVALWIERWPGMQFRLAGLGRGLVVLAIFGRFVVPVAGWTGNQLTEQFLAADLRDAVSSMNAASGSLEKYTTLAVTTGDAPARPATSTDPTPVQPTPSTPGPDASAPQTYLGQARNFVSGAIQGATSLAQGASSAAQAAVSKGQAIISNVQSWVPDSTTIGSIAGLLQGLPDKIVKAIAIFLVQTILAPVFVGVLLYSGLRIVTRPVQKQLVVSTQGGLAISGP